MSRKDVLTGVPAGQLDAANSYMVGLFGDDPGTQEISLNAYVSGQDQTVATVSVAVANCSNADASNLSNYMTTTPGCSVALYPGGSGTDYWAEALRLWNYNPVVTVVP